MTQISKKSMHKYRPNKNKGKSKKKGNDLKGGSRHPINYIYPPGDPLGPRRPNWIQCRNGICSTLVHVPGIYLYGTSLPEWSQREMENIFRFYLFRKDINRVISFQACATPAGVANHPSCMPPNNQLENIVFDQQKALSPTTNVNSNVVFTDIFIMDMTSGSLVAWHEFTLYRFSSANERTAIHCLAGFGRTGTALLFFSLYYKANIFDILLTPYFGRGSSRNMYTYINNWMQQNIVIDDNPIENDPWNGNILSFNPANIRIETTKFNDRNGMPCLFHANLFISRINYCILFFAYQHNVPQGTPIYLYQLLSIYDIPDEDNLFSRPILGQYVSRIFDPAVLNGVFIQP